MRRSTRICNTLAILWVLCGLCTSRNYIHLCNAACWLLEYLFGEKRLRPHFGESVASKRINWSNYISSFSYFRQYVNWCQLKQIDVTYACVRLLINYFIYSLVIFFVAKHIKNIINDRTFFQWIEILLFCWFFTFALFSFWHISKPYCNFLCLICLCYTRWPPLRARTPYYVLCSRSNSTHWTCINARAHIHTFAPYRTNWPSECTAQTI